MSKSTGLTTAGVVFIVAGAALMTQNTGVGAAFIAIGCAISAGGIVKKRDGGDGDAG